MLAIVSSRKVRREIVKNTKQGNYVEYGDFLNGKRRDGFFVVHNDVLFEANKILNNTIDNPTTEFEAVLETKGSGVKVTFEDHGLPGSGEGSGRMPAVGDVSIHSHPIVLQNKKTGLYTPADVASSKDQYPDEGGDVENIFPHFDLNIIVGNNGMPTQTTDAFGSTEWKWEKDLCINFYSQGKKPFASITQENAKSMLYSGDRGRLGQIFDKKHKYNTK